MEVGLEKSVRFFI